MLEILRFETVVMDTGEGISIICNGKEVAIFDYETRIDHIPFPQWVMEAIQDSTFMGVNKNDDEAIEDSGKRFNP